jgi:hypothetical protein
LNDFNPYAAPETSISPAPIADDSRSTGQGVWRSGETLVMLKTALLPHRCVKCNATARRLLDRSLTWYHPAYLWLLLLGFIPGAILLLLLVLFIQRDAKIQVPLCMEHWSSRRQANLRSVIGIIIGIALCLTPLIDRNFAIVAILGAGLLVFSAIYGVIQGAVVKTLRIDKEQIWLQKISPAYLDTLPTLPGLVKPSS